MYITIIAAIFILLSFCNLKNSASLQVLSQIKNLPKLGQQKSM